MMHAAARLLRTSAYEILTWRDGLRRWRSSRDDFRRLLTLSPDELQRQTRLKLNHLLDHAFNTVPYYRDTWGARGFGPGEPVTADRLADLPVLTKDTLRSLKADLVSNAFAADRLDRDCTGGTTHTRTEFYRDHQCSVARFGRQWGILEHCGYLPGDRRSLIWGMRRDLLLPAGRATLRDRYRQFASGDLLFHCGIMKHAEMQEYLERLRRFRPAVLYGYPSALAEFATLVRDERAKPIKVARIFCTAEPLHSTQRALLEEVFGGEVFDLYCTREHGCIGFECQKHAGFHIDVGSVFVEILREGRPVRPGEAGDVVITDLLNYGMPLVRNLVGDVAALAQVSCDCSSPLPLIARVHGRQADNLYQRNGSIVVGHLLSYLFTDLPSIRRTQFVQEDLGSVDVYLVCDPDAFAAARDDVIQRVGSIMGPATTVRTHAASDLPRNPRSGKFQEVICRIAESDRVRLSQASR
jgi:phenylacetate-CoA ligase